MFNIINSSYMAENEIIWEKCVDVCTDGSRAMTGKNGRGGGACKTVSAVLFE